MITVFGSINIDQIYQVEAFPAPGETVIGKGYIEVPGGKGANQAIAARRSGAEVRMIGCVEQSAHPLPALEYLISDDVILDAVQVVAHPTGSASIWVNETGENSIIVNPGANQHLKADLVSDAHLLQSSFLLLQMEVSLVENWALLERAKKQGVKTVLNLAPVGQIPEKILHDLDYLIVNEGEAKALADLIGLEFRAPQSFVLELREIFSLCTVLTMGEKGVVTVDAGEVIEIPARNIVAKDTTAAGDSFIGALFSALSLGCSFTEALSYAVLFAGETCTRIGAQSSIPYKTDLKI